MRADPARAIVAHVLRSGRVSSLVWGSAFGLVVYSSSATYASAYPTQRQRLGLGDSLSANTGLQSLFGVTRGVDTVGGFAAWRSLGLLTIVGAIWGVLTGARLLRGEEDAGRLELFLAGPLSRGRAARAGVAGAALLWVQLLALTAVGAVLGSVQAHIRLSAMLFLALTDCMPAAVFLCAGLLAGQLGATRSIAARMGAIAFGVCYVIRLVSIATGSRWASWLSPLGWIDAAHPVTGSRWWPLACVAVLVSGMLAASVAIAQRRDLGSAPLGRLDGHTSRRLLLGSVEAFTVRVSASRWIGWYAGAATMCLVLGLVSKAVGQQADSSRSIGHLLSQLGAHASGAAIFLGLAMSMMTCLVGMAAAASSAAVCEEELSGRAATLLATTVSRRRWYAGHIAVAALAVTGLATLIGVLLIGVGAVQGLGIGLPSMLSAGINTAPLALAVLGLGLCAHGLAPRLAVGFGYALIGWSFLVEFVGAAVSAPNWVLDLSLLHHVALAPAAAPRWGTNLILIGIGALAAALAVQRFSTRDLVGA